MEYIDTATAPGHPLLRAFLGPDSDDPSDPLVGRPALRRVIRFL